MVDSCIHSTVLGPNEVLVASSPYTFLSSILFLVMLCSYWFSFFEWEDLAQNIKVGSAGCMVFGNYLCPDDLCFGNVDRLLDVFLIPVLRVGFLVLPLALVCIVLE